MLGNLESYRERFVGIQTGLTGEVARGTALIEELLNQLENTKSILKQTKFDLDNELEARRRLQEQLEEGRELSELQGRRPFVVALIDADADCYVFRDQFLEKGEKGGEEAADALLEAMKQFVRDLPMDPEGVSILVRAYANFNGLGGNLHLKGRLKDKEQLRAFAVRFSSRQPFFDFVDIGPGTDRADEKVRESIKFFLDSFQCKHLVLACGHDDGYATCLGQRVGDKQVAKRITVVEGGSFPKRIRNLGLNTARFSSVFNDVPHSPTSASPVSGQPVVTLPVRMTAAFRGSSLKSWTTTGPAGKNPLAQWEKLGPVLTGHGGRRIDRPLQVDKAVGDKIKKAQLCFYFYLRGECVKKCQRHHEFPGLSNEEFDALWDHAPQGRCVKSTKADREGGEDCSDVMCIYGH